MKNSNSKKVNLADKPTSIKVLKLNGQNNIERLHIHQVKMNEILQKWQTIGKQNIQISHSVPRLPCIYPLPYLKTGNNTSLNQNIIDGKTKLKFLKENDNLDAEYVRNQELPSNSFPKLRNFDASSELYTNFTEKSTKDHLALNASRNLRKKSKTLGLTEIETERINSILKYENLDNKSDLGKFRVSKNNYKILKMKMKMNQIDGKKMADIAETIKSLERNELIKQINDCKIDTKELRHLSNTHAKSDNHII